MNLSEQLYKNLQQRAYSYVDGGLYEKDEWKEKMTSYLEAYNDLLGLSKAEIDDLVEEILTKYGGECDVLNDNGVLCRIKLFYDVEDMPSIMNGNVYVE